MLNLYEEYGIKISEGEGRNNAMYQKASSMLKRYGNTQDIFRSFVQLNEDMCDPPLDEQELVTVWKSAVKSFKRNVEPA